MYLSTACCVLQKKTNIYEISSLEKSAHRKIISHRSASTRLKTRSIPGDKNLLRDQTSNEALTKKQLVQMKMPF